MRRARGFTLIEVMVALFLVAVAVAAAARFNMQNQDTLALMRNRDTAVLLARATCFELVQEGVNAATDKEDDYEGEYEGFHWHAKARSVGLDDYYRLVVRVSWDAPRRGSVSIEQLFEE